ncbi:amino acid ABC transporter permease [Pseudorhodoplanes sp.]|uniref:amino acid ABC transporter permease n=1 Tax=Pseudorhodoplanes sp. TaxID=1934341 RepID=UPI003D11F182
MTPRSANILFVMQLALIAILICALFLGQYQLVALSWRILLQGACMTILLTAISYAVGITIAFVIALIRFQRVPLFGWMIGGFVEIVRASPQLMVIFWIYFGVPYLFKITLSPIAAALISLIVVASAYISEVFRAGLLGIPKNQFETAHALGHSFWQTQHHVILPQVLRNMYPALLGQLVMLFKISSLLYVIGVIDFYRAVTIVNNREYIPIEAFVLLILFYYSFGVIFVRIAAVFGREIKY